MRLAGDVLSEELDNFSASGGACQVMDIDGDGANEVVPDATDYYVFCYACGVRKYDYTVQRWNGTSFDRLELQPLPAAAPEELVAKNDELLRLGLKQGKDVKACPCKTIVPFYRKHVFAQIKPATRTRIDFGFALQDTPASGRLLDTGGRAKGDRITHRIPVTKPEDIDDEVRHWLKTAYDLDA